MHVPLTSIQLHFVNFGFSLQDLFLKSCSRNHNQVSSLAGLKLRLLILVALFPIARLVALRPPAAALRVIAGPPDSAWYLEVFSPLASVSLSVVPKENASMIRL